MFLSNEKNKKPYICAIYTRISDQEKSEISQHDSIENQFSMCKKYIELHEEAKWTIHPVRYDDRNISGGTMKRPALGRLIEDVRAGKVNMVVIKAIDRLTRSLKDFYDLWEIFKAHNVEIASATQEFNTASPTGRLHLDIVLRFAQYERELASERTKDKMAFQASKGMYHGGYPPLGFDFHPSKKGELLPNAKEIPLVRLIFRKYAEIQSAHLVSRFCNDNGHTTKLWKTVAGEMRGGKRFTEAIVINILRKITYIGKTGSHEKSHRALWEGIVHPRIFERVQQIIKANTIHNGSISQNKHGLLLVGLVWCKFCGSQMTHNTSVKKDKTYLYYQCTKVGHADRTACEIRRVSARALERIVIQRINFLSQNKELLEKATKRAMKLAKENLRNLHAERNRVIGQQQQVEKQSAPLLRAFGKTKFGIIQEKLKPLDDRREVLKEKLLNIDEGMAKEKQKIINPDEVMRNLRYFDAVFHHLPFEKKRDLLHLLVKKVIYDKDPAKISITFYSLPEIKKPPTASKNGAAGGSSYSLKFDERAYWLPGRANKQGLSQGE